MCTENQAAFTRHGRRERRRVNTTSTICFLHRSSYDHHDHKYISQVGSAYCPIALLSSVPSTFTIHGTLVSLNSSACGFATLCSASGSSSTPALIIFMPGKLSPSLNSVVPQSPQKCDVIFLPVSADLAMGFGAPLMMVKPSSGTTMLTE